jgi:hypothetical protein
MVPAFWAHNEITKNEMQNVKIVFFILKYFKYTLSVSLCGPLCNFVLLFSFKELTQRDTEKTQRATEENYH